MEFTTLLLALTTVFSFFSWMVATHTCNIVRSMEAIFRKVDSKNENK